MAYEVALHRKQLTENVKQRYEGMVRCMVQVGVPMFFYISGVATTFHKTGNVLMFWKAKFVRLMVPFIFAVVFFLIPRLYLTQDFSPHSRIDGKEEWNFMTYYTRMAPFFIFKMSWLWFLLALFIDSAVSYPFLKWSQRRQQNLEITFKDDILTIAGQIGMLALYSAVLLSMAGTRRQALLAQHLMVLVTYGFLMFVPSLMKRRAGASWYKYSPWLCLIGPVSCLFLNLVQEGTDKEPRLHGFLSQLGYDLVFMAQGILN
mgnify:CR=1 FL=1